MKALVYEAPWQMPLRQLDPPQPNPGDAVVAVRAVGICGSDVHGFMGTTGRRKPSIVMGHEFCGVISAVGSQVTTLIWPGGSWMRLRLFLSRRLG